MELTITIEHLAPYLPYGLEVMQLSDHKSTISKRQLEGLTESGAYLFGLYKPWKYSKCKPILRPLSDLKKDIEHEGNVFTPFNQFFREARKLIDKELELTGGKLMVDYLTWEVLRMLFKWHFDVFGLIEADLAIDINTLNK